MEFSWEDFLHRHRQKVIDTWVRKLKTQVSTHYAQRSVMELNRTVGNAYDSFGQVILNNDFTKINAFINEITRIRLEAGFPLDDVQKAFELFRQIITPVLIIESPKEILGSNLKKTNSCLAYTIHRFSNHFQKVHEKYLKEYAQRLEQDVKIRTAELQESEYKYKTLVEEINDGFLVIDQDIIAFVNQSFCRMHGYEMDEMVAKSFLNFVAEESRIKVSAIISTRTSKEPESGMFGYNRLTQNGRALPTEVTFRPVLFKKKKFKLCLCRDITKRVEMEKRVRDAERLAYIGHITASLSHEIRNPLSSVKMNLQIMGKNKEFQGNDKRRLEISEREIMRLEGILQELLDFAKPLSLNFAPTSLGSIIYGCAELLDMKFKEKNIDCAVEVDPNLPRIHADQGKMEQVIINLLLNAIDSVDQVGTIKVLANIHHRDTQSFVLVQVEDDGNRIPEEHLNRIFKPFYTTKTTGTGLGLANVQKIVDAHNGFVEVNNVHPLGVAFRVYIPIEETHWRNP